MSNVDLQKIWLRERTDERVTLKKVAIAISKIIPSDGDDYELLISEAVRGDEYATCELALALHRDPSIQPWLSRSWLWLAACMDSKDAQMLLARELALSATDIEPPMAPDVLQAKSLQWLNAELSPSHQAARPGVSDGERVTVVSKIGDPASREGRDLASRYAEIVGKPIGFSGAGISPHKLRSEMLHLWPWADSVAKKVAADLLLLEKKFDPRSYLRPLLLVGEPGCGKTSMLEWLGEKLGLHVSLVACAGANDAGGLSSVTRGWATSRPCLPFQLMSESGTANPFIILDEIDKGTSIGSQNGSIVGAALNMLSSSGKFFDNCLMANVDISYVSFMATANDISQVPAPLLDRFTVINVPKPRLEDFDGIIREIASGHVVRNTNHPVPDIFLTGEEIDFLFKVFADSSRSIRVLKKAYSSLLSASLNAPEMPPLLN